MQLLKPVWVSGDGQAFMSIDIHPDGIRFATGGQGEDCGRVSIWNIKPILDEKAAKDKEVPKLLTQMDHHLGCVNCVRWSNNGKYLASGGDDKLVSQLLVMKWSRQYLLHARENVFWQPIKGLKYRFLIKEVLFI